jgi:hypothetical protein
VGWAPWACCAVSCRLIIDTGAVLGSLRVKPHGSDQKLVATGDTIRFGAFMGMVRDKIYGMITVGGVVAFLIHGDVPSGEMILPPIGRRWAAFKR